MLQFSLKRVLSVVFIVSVFLSGWVCHREFIDVREVAGPLLLRFHAVDQVQTAHQHRLDDLEAKIDRLTANYSESPNSSRHAGISP